MVNLFDQIEEEKICCLLMKR